MPTSEHPGWVESSGTWPETGVMTRGMVIGMVGLLVLPDAAITSTAQPPDRPWCRPSHQTPQSDHRCRLDCSAHILSHPPTNNVRVVRGAVGLPAWPAAGVLQLASSGTLGAPRLFAKMGLVIRAGVPSIEIRHGPDGSVPDLGRKTRVISTPLRRALKERDHGCRFPGCTNTRFVDGHHIQHWADGGETKLDNLILLCSYHHQRVHEGGFRMESTAQGLTFKSPHGWNIPLLPPKTTEPPAPLPPATCDMPTWAGDRMDYDFALQFTA